MGNIQFNSLSLPPGTISELQMVSLIPERLQDKAMQMAEKDYQLELQNIIAVSKADKQGKIFSFLIVIAYILLLACALIIGSTRQFYWLLGLGAAIAAIVGYVTNNKKGN